MRQGVIDGFSDDSYAAVDDRYADFQYHRRTSLAKILGAYVAAHRDEFIAG